MVIESVLAFTHDTVAAFDPTFTVAVASKLVPLIVTVSPPVLRPEFGEALVTVGAAAADARCAPPARLTATAINATHNKTLYVRRSD
jgi:hypothetical protein